jgi:hypothetical protein
MRANRSSLSTLDRMRMQQGISQFRANFLRLGKAQRQQAISYLNEARLRFPSLYLLIPEIQHLELYENLNPRNKVALKTCAQIMRNQEIQSKLPPLSPEEKKSKAPILKWILQTGMDADGLSPQYDQIIDSATAMLASNTKENDLLPQIADMVFKRNNKESYLHDLVWAFFESRNPETLRHLASHLLSQNPQEVRLAKKLLNLPADNSEGPTDPRLLYTQYIAWFQENLPYLYYTGESMQFSSNPSVFRVNLEAKYLHKKVSPATGNPIIPPNAEEQSILRDFRELDDDGKSALADYSLSLHKKDMKLWKEWLQTKPSQQLAQAKAEQEGAS